MPAKTKTQPAPVTAFSFVGNVGCVRFPPPIRKASGIKRGDRLAMTVDDGGTITLDRVQAAIATAQETLPVAGCACQNAPAGCAAGGPTVLTVGWSYVRLAESRAVELGLVPGAPLRLVGEPGTIAISVHRNPRDLEGVPPAVCPP